MRIAITVDPEIPVPPVFYGGIERIVSMLVNEFISAGNDVTLFAHKLSKTDAALKAYSGKKSKSPLDSIRNMHLISREVYRGNFDVIHSFSRLAYLSLVLPTRLPKIMSYQRRPTTTQIEKAQKLAYKDSLVFTGCSDFISDQIRPFGLTRTIYNGFPENTFRFSERVGSDAPLVFLGRVEPLKGPHLAIQIAKKANRNLIIAGNIPSGYQTWFTDNIAPEIDGDKVKYVGPVNDHQKSKLLGSALAFLMPIEWDEPFGIVMVEAMACGTPVIALSHGAVPEIVDNGITGYICKNLDECTQKISDIYRLDRRTIMQVASARFGAKTIARDYLNLYGEMVDKNIK